MNITKTLNQIGDTIIEVMIAILVLSLTIGGAYGIANRSLKSARQAQEHGEALKLAESQLENVKAQAIKPGTTIFSTNNFCFDAAGNPTTSSCQFNNRYNVSISQTSQANNVYQFTIRVQWESVGLSGTDQITMYYRVINES
jgi:Tfp pilus assembly protein PilV